jgi:hypothetical protein
MLITKLKKSEKKLKNLNTGHRIQKTGEKSGKVSPSTLRMESLGPLRMKDSAHSLSGYQAIRGQRIRTSGNQVFSPQNRYG